MLKVVLLANGIGSDPATYRPESDESQWWNRRDALVRCVTAFFFGYLPDDSGGANDDSRPPSQDSLQWPDGGSCQKELHIVFDEDWSTFCMTLSSSRPRATSSRNNRGRSKAATSAEDTEFVPLKVPTERNIVALWKRSAAHPGECIEQDGLLCRMIVSKTIHPTSLTSPVATSASQVFGSKRELVEHLQSTCSMDFLREHK
jgi:hypothetical protein